MSVPTGFAGFPTLLKQRLPARSVSGSGIVPIYCRTPAGCRPRDLGNGESPGARVDVSASFIPTVGADTWPSTEE